MTLISYNGAVSVLMLGIVASAFGSNFMADSESSLHSTIFNGYKVPSSLHHSLLPNQEDLMFGPVSHWIVYAASILVGLLVVYRIVLEQLNEMAWFAAVDRMKRDDATKKRPILFDYTYGWTFVGIAPPKWGIENCFHSLIHVPAYMFRYFRLLVWVLPRDAFRRYILRIQVTDEMLYTFITHTMLIMLCDTDKTGDTLTYKAESCCKELFITKDEHIDCPIDGSTLTVVFHKGNIVEAKTADGPVVAQKWLTRNEIICDALAITMSLWAHSQIHVAGERCSAQIARLEIDQLKPCALHTFSIHDALLNSPISAIRHSHPFVAWPNRLRSGVWNLHNKIPHDLTRIQTPEKFRCYHYFLRAHSVVARLLKKHKLAHWVDVDDFFALVVMHDVDHAVGFQYFWDKLPLRPSNNDSWTQYWVSMYRNSCHQQMWVAANTNPFWSMYIKDSGNPILRELYHELAKLDPELAGIARYCISF